MPLYTLDKTAYKSFAQTFVPASRYTLASKYGKDMAATWQLSTFYNKKGNRGVWVPQIKLLKYNNEEEVNALRLAFGIGEPADVE